jgi:hypothetical protein
MGCTYTHMSHPPLTTTHKPPQPTSRSARSRSCAS